MSAPIMLPPYRLWLEKAAQDDEVVRLLLTVPDAPANIVCFHAQQAAEKTLKAFLVYHNTRVRKTHVLEELLPECARFDASLASLLVDCTLLTPFGVASRYPGLVPDPTEQETRDAVAAMERIRAAVFVLLPA